MGGGGAEGGGRTPTPGPTTPPAAAGRAPTARHAGKSDPADIGAIGLSRPAGPLSAVHSSSSGSGAP